ncbi:hypothetical protein L218DRAFT_986112 [Marasmius fiardii PR-910]|nr:hypothetical protein L218DRAFT_986112 [Marasmius fiardii PR-910]
MKLYQATSWGCSTMTNNTYYDDNSRTVYKVNTPFKFSNRTTTITKTKESERQHVIFSPSRQANTSIGGGKTVEEYDLLELHTDSSGLRRRKSDTKSDTKSVTSSINIDGKSPSGWAEDTDDQTLVNDSIAGSSNSTVGIPSLRVFEYLAQIDWRFFASSRFRFGDGGEIEAKELFRKEGWGPYGRHRVFMAKDGREYKWYLRYWYSELTLNNEEKTPVAKFHRKYITKCFIGKGTPAYLEILPAGEHMVDEIFTTFIYIEKLRKEKERAARPNGGGGP